MDDGQIRVHEQGNLLHVVFDRPAKKNAFTVSMYEALVEVMKRADHEDVRAVVFSGEGGAFTAGNDLMDFIQAPPISPSHPVLQFLHALVDCQTPLVAAVDGPAIGIGTTMLLHFDMVIASERAQLRLPFVPLGLVPEGGSSLLLPRIVGPTVASELLLLGESFSAHRALSLGLVNSLAPEETLIDEAIKVGKKFALLPPTAVRKAKELLIGPHRQALHDVIDAEAAVFAERLQSQEAIEAMTAFMQKRKPNFTTETS